MLTKKRLARAVFSRLSRLSKLMTGLVGPRKYYCNCCKKFVSGFYTFGDSPARCPYCNSFHRERFIVYCLAEKRLTLPSVEGGILHAAPSEGSLIKTFQSQPDYHPVDLFPEIYEQVETQKMDLMTMSEVNRYRLVYLSHVMEHVPDDTLVLQNLFRSLKVGGEGWFMIPMRDQQTQDGTDDMTARDRERLFGQWDHARQYGPDFQERLRKAGFEVEILKPDSAPSEDFNKLGFHSADWIFVAKKTRT